MLKKELGKNCPPFGCPTWVFPPPSWSAACFSGGGGSAFINVPQERGLLRQGGPTLGVDQEFLRPPQVRPRVVHVPLPGAAPKLAAPDGGWVKGRVHLLRPSSGLEIPSWFEQMAVVEPLQDPTHMHTPTHTQPGRRLSEGHPILRGLKPASSAFLAPDPSHGSI